MSERKDEGIGSRFHEFLEHLRNGTAAIEYERKLEEVVRAVTEIGKPGKLVLTFTIKPADEADNVHIVITESVKASPPEPGRGRTFLFAQKDGRLGVQDPRQPSLLDLKQIEEPGKVRRIHETSPKEGA
jgi:hypothetical protein